MRARPETVENDSQRSTLGRPRRRAISLRFRTLPALLGALAVGLVGANAQHDARAANTTNDTVVAPSHADATVWVNRIERLSLNLRGHRLTEAERADLGARLATEDAAKVFEKSLDAWMNGDYFRRTLDFPRTGHLLFLANLVRRHDPKSGNVYALAEDAPGDSACAPAERKKVHPWWAVNTTIDVCANSYNPSKVFDEIGYCAGQADPRLGREPRRPGCGCGPFMIGCLPPHDEGALDDKMDEEARDEPVVTLAEILDKQRPFDEMLTTSTTWQSGLVEFIYMRRLMLAELASHPYDEAFEARWRKSLKAVDVARPGHWVTRTGPYKGAGILVSTPEAEGMFDTYRSQMNGILGTFLCVDFDGVGVDRDSVLRVVGANHANVRSLKIHDSPMRNQEGCSGCHAPMDHGAAFLVGLRTQLLGAYPTGETAPGKLYVHGANDYRGSGTGYEGLFKLVTAQPEFATCAVDASFTQIAGRSYTPAEAPMHEAMLAEFAKNGHALVPILKRIYKSDAYLSPTGYR